MAKVKNMGDLTLEQLNHEVENGAKFITFQYCISLLVITFKRSSDIYFVRPGESFFGVGLGFTLLSLIMGWWGIPWGPIYTIGAIFTNLSGGKDITREVLGQFNYPNNDE